MRKRKRDGEGESDACNLKINVDVTFKLLHRKGYRTTTINVVVELNASQWSKELWLSSHDDHHHDDDGTIVSLVCTMTRLLKPHKTDDVCRVSSIRSCESLHPASWACVMISINRIWTAADKVVGV